VPCNLIIRKYQNGNVLDEEIVKSMNINVPANWKQTIEETIDLPICYNWWALDCQDVDELLQCQ